MTSLGQQGIRLTTAAGLALAGIVSLSGSAHAATVAVPYECRTWVQGNTHPVYDYQRGFDVAVPASVRPGERFQATYDPAPITAFAEYNKTVTDVRVAYRIPAGAKVKHVKLTGGSGLGDSTLSVKVEGEDITVSASGPLEGGVEFDLPTLKVTYKAPKDTGTLNFVPGGSSYEQPGFYWYRYQPILDEWGPFECFPDPAKPQTVLASTQVKK
ncbi:dehydratase [Streptomyces sp. MMG1533]|uniref:hypothetical protein n=1 Tax=Streptomyces sp. MMG1533 TaxID=1415546 RepID=UPI0006AE2A62|nr:hypothetical protein [Streptomyces sp. MMG1533]KOU63454.1 dehydratase [Streptomyces sp. MMG1533]